MFAAVHECDALAARGVDTRTLQAFMGHRSIANTVVYTAVADKRIRNIWGCYGERGDGARAGQRGWWLLQTSIMLALLESNVYRHWTPNGYLAAILAVLELRALYLKRKEG